MKILVLNAGSSSLKSHLYDVGWLPVDPPAPLWRLHIDWSRRDTPAEVRIETSSGAAQEREVPVDRLRQEFSLLLATLWTGGTRVIAGPSEVGAVGHRVVHGGETFRESTRITPEVTREIARLSVFAPAHNPIEFSVIEATELILGGEVPEVAVFDTAFHTSLPPAAYLYGGPYDWVEQGIRRYGFHGISHQYVARRAAQMLGKDPAALRLVTCHLGNGCSLAAIRGGRSVDTTMGFTPLDGLIMGTRSGSVDPGILIHLLRHGGYDADRLDRVLNRESGLKGLSGVSSDMREIEAAMAGGHVRAQQAFDAFIHRLRGGTSAMAAALGGLDALVFTAGIGENSATVRASTCEGLAFLGVKLDAERNVTSPSDQDIAAEDSPVRVLVIHTQEDWEIARECFRLIAPVQAEKS
ncbi:MAG TPA: acetate kinase [Terriglobia bacterium]|nr:acetate kinase [Terriglobia bacterium]